MTSRCFYGFTGSNPQREIENMSDELLDTVIHPADQELAAG